MSMYDSILYPTDGSSTAQAPLEHARNQAELHDATVHVLYVIDMEEAGVGLAGDLDMEDQQGMVGAPVGGGTGMVGTREGTGVEELESEAAEVVDTVAERFGNVATRTTIRVGFADETILEYVDDARIDMVVMSTHGRSGVERYVSESVTEKVVRVADVPVLTVRATDT